MIHIQYTTDPNGKMPGATKERLGTALANIRAGENVALSITKSPPFPADMEPSEKLAEIVAWYGGLPGDYNDVTTLLNYARLLACYMADFAGVVGGLAKERNRTEWLRKAEYAARLKEAMRPEKEGAKTSAASAKIEVEALSTIVGLQYDEQRAESELVASRLILDGAARVHDAMRQHIAHLRSEHDNEMRGRGSQ